VDIGQAQVSSNKQKLNMNKMVKLNFMTPILENYSSLHQKVDHLMNSLKNQNLMDGQVSVTKKLFGMMLGA
jgi:hypothetical protein